MTGIGTPDLAGEPPGSRWRFDIRGLSRRSYVIVSFLMVLLIWEVAARTLGTSRATGATIIPDITTTLSAFIAYSNYWVGGLGAGDTRMGADETWWGAVLGLGYNLGITLLAWRRGWRGASCSASASDLSSAGQDCCVTCCPFQSTFCE